MQKSLISLAILCFGIAAFSFTISQNRFEKETRGDFAKLAAKTDALTNQPTAQPPAKLTFVYDDPSEKILSGEHHLGAVWVVAQGMTGSTVYFDADYEIVNVFNGPLDSKYMTIRRKNSDAYETFLLQTPTLEVLWFGVDRETLRKKLEKAPNVKVIRQK